MSLAIPHQHCGVLLVLIRNIGHRTLPKIWIDTFLVWNVHLSGKGFEMILAVIIETGHPAEGAFGREFPAICNHCGVITAWSLKTWILWTIFAFLEKRSLSNCRYCADRAQNLPEPAPHLAHIVPDFSQIGSHSVELLPNAWRPFLSRRVFTIGSSAYNNNIKRSFIDICGWIVADI